MEECQFDPMIYKDAPIGMLHCPWCGEIILAGVPHPKYNQFWDDLDAGVFDEELNRLAEKLELDGRGDQNEISEDV
jgi:hypothetical protein